MLRFFPFPLSFILFFEIQQYLWNFIFLYKCKVFINFFRDIYFLDLDYVIGKLQNSKEKFLEKKNLNFHRSSEVTMHSWSFVP